MNPVTLINETRSIGKPEDWDEEKHGPCDSLSVNDSCLMPHADTDYNIMTSAWKPTEEELEALMNGGHVFLGIYGITHPVVHLYVS